MIEACRAKWPNETFVHGDASAMHQFDDRKFDFVLFSFNGIDSMSHEKRLDTLREVYRVLKPWGLFVFCTHNRDHRRIVTSIDFRDWNVMNNVRNLRSYVSVRSLQERASTYAILSDPLAGYGYLSYYIRKKDQVRQLESVGFCDIDVLSERCEFVEPARSDRRNRWFHYLARKPS